jgi:hypothetical protein
MNALVSADSEYRDSSAIMMWERRKEEGQRIDVLKIILFHRSARPEW